MKRVSVVLLLIFLFTSRGPAQPLWSIYVGSSMYIDVGGDTTVASLKQMFLEKRSIAATRLLAYYHGQTEKDFLLQNLRAWAYENSFPLGISPFYQYQYIRGFFGEQAAINGMDSLIQNSLVGEPTRLDAIRLLAQTGRYDYYTYLQTYYNLGGSSQRNVLGILGLYGMSVQYAQSARTALEGYIRTHPDPIDFMQAANALALFDKPYCIGLLDELFRSSTGQTRSTYFRELRWFDRDGQTQRTIWAVPLEPDEQLRDNYYPSSGAPVGSYSTRYFQPNFIKFALDRASLEASDLVKYDILRFTYTFVPPVPPLDQSLPSMIDTLIDHKAKVTEYGWVGNSAFVNELGVHLTTARATLISGDSANCARQLLIFQKKVNEEYADSLDGDARTVTREGWKFMYYESKYILDRFSFISTINVAQPADYSLVSVPSDLGYFLKTQTYPRSSSAASRFVFNVGYVAKDTLANGLGYWLQYPTIDTANYYGINLQTTSVAVDTGWNLIGSISQDIHKSKVAPQGVTILSNYFGYQKGVGYFVADTLKSGRGYWIKVAEKGSLLLGGNYTGGGGGTEPPPPPIGAPTTPVLQTPSANATNVNVTSTLSWYPVTGTVTYQLQVATDSLFAGLIFNQSGLTSTSRQIGPLSYYTIYYYRVNATNSNGTSYWSQFFKFTTQLPPTAPPAPTLASPANGATGVPTIPVVYWNESSTATSYRLQVSVVSTFASVDQDVSGIQMTSKVLATLSNSTTYYWRVNATNATGTSSWSSVWHFTTQASSGGGCGEYSSIQAMDQFTVKDTRGNSQKLYVHNRGRALKFHVPDLSLPPEPPLGTFSARFGSNQFIEGIQPNKPSAKIPIKLRDAGFPITLEWDINPANKLTYWLTVPGKKPVKVPMTGKGSKSLSDPGSGGIIIESTGIPPCQ